MFSHPCNAANRIAFRACYARRDDPIFAKFRSLGAVTFLGRPVADVGDFDHPVQLPGYHMRHYREAGCWYIVCGAYVGDKLCAQAVADEKMQTVLDMLTDASHPLWQEDPGYAV